MKSNINFSYLIFLSVVAALGGFLFGYDAAVISGTISQVTVKFGLDEIQIGWFVGCALIGSIIGVLFAGKLSDMWGRKVTMLIAAVFFSVSGIGCAFSDSLEQLVFARMLGGIGIGIVSVVSPLYISEVSIAQYRGRLVALYQLAITIGFLGAYLTNLQLLHLSQSGLVLSVDWLNLIFVSEVWRGMLGFSCISSLLFFFILFFIPESPRWLILKGRDGLAKSILQKIYLVPQDTTEQLQEIKSVIRSEVKSDWSFLLQPGILKAVLIGAAIAILGQFMGVNAVLYYGPTIFEEAGLSGGDALFSQVLVGVVNAVTTVIAVFIIDKVGRKKLVYYGVSGMILSLLLIGFYFSFNVADATPIMCREFVQESDVEAEDRVEIFFSASKDMGQYYCMEIDPSGHVMDYSASYYRKFDYEWNFKSLEICSIKDEKGYIVAGRLSVSELLELGIDLEEFYMGVFRADFTTPNTVIWYSSVSINEPKPDFHNPNILFPCMKK